MNSSSAIAFGPVPSRRLGRSLGINNIPPKHCSYSCTYCQVGRTTRLVKDRRSFHAPDTIAGAVVRHVKKAGERIDYLCFVPDGEPTLDVNLGASIGRLRPLGLPIAVISNASLIHRPDVRRDLSRADWVSLKLDSVVEEAWRKVNRPHRGLELARILGGIEEFARSFEGTLVTETMLVEGLNDRDEHARELAGFLGRLQPSRAYLAIPTRPPAERRVRTPREDVVNRVFQILSGSMPRVEYLTGFEGDAFAATGNAEEDLLSITAVHPLREQSVRELINRNHAGWDLVEALLRRGELARVGHAGTTYYTRKWRR
jgi:wyosine [tRNA(Phe)-imidazoG37] synthetase (radical SAM superfamily)